MAYFHSKWVRSRGGLKRRLMRRLIGESAEEMLSVSRAYKESVTITWPPRSRDSWKSKSLPMLLIDADRDDVLEALESTKVPDEYITVLTMMLREELYRTRVGHTEETRKFFETEIRGKLILLLRSGEWIDEPETLGLKTLNARLEKIDLGRRSDLKFSSEQSGRPKYDADAHRDDDIEEEAPWHAEYRNANPEKRRELYEATPPWRQSLLRERFGEP